MRFATCTKPPKEKTGKKIAIIGAGPGGLTVAGGLICKGYDVDVYDMLPEPGGMLIFGIPDIRMPKDRIIEGIRELEKLGVNFICGKKVGEDIDFGEILEKYDAVVIATGAWEDIKLGLPGEESQGVYHALDFLVTVARINRGYLPREKMPEVGKKVVVIGGGNTAIDVSLVTRSMGSDVTIVYRRTREYMPAKPHEIKMAEQRGVKFMFLLSPKEVIVDNGGKVRGIVCEKMKLGEPDASRRPRPVPTGETITIECDTVIFAIGEIATPPFKDPEKYGIKVDRKNRIIVDENYMTTRRGVFAIGDVVTGPKDIPSAIKAAKKVVEVIHEYLSQ